MLKRSLVLYFVSFLYRGMSGLLSIFQLDNVPIFVFNLFFSNFSTNEKKDSSRVFSREEIICVS